MNAHQNGGDYLPSLINTKYENLYCLEHSLNEDVFFLVHLI